MIKSYNQFIFENSQLSDTEASQLMIKICDYVEKKCGDESQPFILQSKEFETNGWPTRISVDSKKTGMKYDVIAFYSELSNLKQYPTKIEFKVVRTGSLNPYDPGETSDEIKSFDDLLNCIEQYENIGFEELIDKTLTQIKEEIYEDDPDFDFEDGFTSEEMEEISKRLANLFVDGSLKLTTTSFKNLCIVYDETDYSEEYYIRQMCSENKEFEKIFFSFLKNTLEDYPESYEDYEKFIPETDMFKYLKRGKEGGLWGLKTENYESEEVDTEIQREYKLIQDILDSKNVRFVADKHNTTPMENYIVFLDREWADKILKNHSIENTPIGSVFFSDINLRKLILEVIRDKKPTEIVNGTYKWLGVIVDDYIGIDNIKKTNNFRKLKMMKDYKVSPTESIKVAYEDGRRTRHLSIIAEEIGKIKNMPLLNIITAFPGNTGLDVTNRNDFSSYGYYFTSKSKIVKKMYEIE